MKFIFILSIIAFPLVAPQVSHAYIGPGAGIAAIGTVLALIGGILLAIVAFIWYPVKRLMAKVRKKKISDEKDLS